MWQFFGRRFLIRGGKSRIPPNKAVFLFAFRKRTATMRFGTEEQSV
jgi:hypothetical protein